MPVTSKEIEVGCVVEANALICNHYMRKDWMYLENGDLGQIVAVRRQYGLSSGQISEFALEIYGSLNGALCIPLELTFLDQMSLITTSECMRRNATEFIMLRLLRIGIPFHEVGQWLSAHIRHRCRFCRKKVNARTQQKHEAGCSGLREGLRIRVEDESEGYADIHMQTGTIDGWLQTKGAWGVTLDSGGMEALDANQMVVFDENVGGSVKASDYSAAVETHEQLLRAIARGEQL